VTAEILASALESLAVFPLPGVVLFPGTLLPLHIFEPRYRTMLAECMAGSRCMAMAFQLDEPVDVAGEPRWSPIAGVGRVVHHVMLRDGRSNIVLQGLARVRLEELPFVPPYRRARAEIADDAPRTVPSIDRAALQATASALAAAASVTDFEIPSGLEPGASADLCAHQLLRDGAARQAILEELDPAARVRLVTSHLAEQLVRVPHAPVGAGSA
jgi:Lon protease-like protein